MLEKIFALRERRTSVRVELLAGLTTFMTMAYILAVNPSILSQAGMDSSAVFVATALSAAVATGLMGCMANLPIAVAPSMGQNAFFAYTIVLGMGHSWQFALTAVFLVGLLFIILTVCNLREALLHAMPECMKHAITVGVGLFIAFIGLQSAGFVVHHPTTFVTLGSLSSPGMLVGAASILFTTILLCFRVRGALFYGIITGTLLGIPLGVTQLTAFDTALFFTVPSIAPTFWQFEWTHVLSMDMFMVVIVFLFGNLFDTMATLLGVAKKAHLLDENGQLAKSKNAFMVDALGTTCGAIFGTSPLTTYVESVSGVAEGGRTGLMAVTVSILFVLSLFMAPLFLLIPQQATAAILILVGVFMVAEVVYIDFTQPLTAIPAFFTLLLMPLTYSIATGIMGGIILHVLLHIVVGKWREVSLFTCFLAVIFTIKFVYG